MKTISELLNSPIKKVDEDDEIDNNDHFQPIIDFPNFLLIVLKITRLWNEDDFNPLSFTLDDKELIKEFEKVNLTPEFVMDFAYNLLLAKYFLDNYIIHHTNVEDRAIENPWELQYYFKKGNKAAYLKDLYEDNKEKQEEVIQLLSMFEVTFTPKQRKSYLFYCLYHLLEDCELNNYVEFLRKLADKYFFDVYLDASKLNDINQPKPNSFDETILNGNELNVELEDTNCFGNFAMIGVEANSSGSYWDPKTKLDHYSDGKSDQVSVASLKFRVMMQICQDNLKAMLNGELDRVTGMEWNAEDMQIHQSKILDIIIG